MEIGCALPFCVIVLAMAQAAASMLPYVIAVELALGTLIGTPVTIVNAI
jgi:hypothetical protein